MDGSLGEGASLGERERVRDVRVHAESMEDGGGCRSEEGCCCCGWGIVGDEGTC